MPIKERETDNRTSTGQTRITASRQDKTALKQFKKYLSVGANKTKHFQFSLNDWQDHSILKPLEKKRYLLSFRIKAMLFKLLKEKF